MTTSAPTAVQQIVLPPPGNIVLTHMLTDPLFPDKKPQVMACPHCKQSLSVPSATGKDEPIAWVIGQPHPFMNEMKVIRMFLVTDGVDIYSVTTNGKAGVRSFIPMKSVRLTEQAMPLDVFADELADAEEEDADDPDPDDPDPGDPGPEPELAPPPAVPVSNGQNPS